MTHAPVYIRVPSDGNSSYAVGCACGLAPKKPSGRISTTYNWFTRHAPAIYPIPDPTFITGPAKGMTTREWYAANPGTKASINQLVEL